jgi:serine/threonine-protein kinase
MPTVKLKGADTEAPLTDSRILLGTPLYMAPEVVDRTRAGTPAVDVFGFGVIAYLVLTGHHPFQTSPALATVNGTPLPPPEPMGIAKPDVPASVAHMIDRCLAFEPADRPTAREVYDTLTSSGSVQ